MAHQTSRRTAARASRAHSIVSEDSFAATPRATPIPSTRRSSARGIRANSIVSDATSLAEGHQPISKPTKLPAHYSSPPTVPSPFTGTLEASLDAVLEWGNRYADSQIVVDTLLREVDRSTNWPELLRKMWIEGDEPAGRGRYLVEELLFLVTRTLLPEQITENRAAMARLYDWKKQLAIRLLLRYDMLREWKIDSSNSREYAIAVASLPPANLQPPAMIPARNPERFPYRRQLMPNIVSTLIVAPAGGFTTHGVRERMRHHVTDLDDYLLLSDEKVASWSDLVLIGMTSQIVLQWQWLRQNNGILQDMEVYGWEELDCKADECEWIADDVTKRGVGKKDTKAVGTGAEEADAK